MMRLKTQFSNMPFDRERIKEKVTALAAKGVFIGTSSWKYQGWLGQLYTASRYKKETKSIKDPEGQGFLSGLEIVPTPLKPEKIDKEKFERGCLAEYAEVFKTVSVDAAFYKFPDEKSLGKLVAQVPADFLFAFKVTDGITIKRFPTHEGKLAQPL